MKRVSLCQPPRPQHTRLLGCTKPKGAAQLACMRMSADGQLSVPLLIGHKCPIVPSKCALLISALTV
jgi:hypothetical protein